MTPSPIAGASPTALEVIFGRQRGRRFTIAGEGNTILGRNKNANNENKNERDNVVDLMSEIVSRSHARISIRIDPAGDPNTHLVEVADLESTNGTFLNGRRVPSTTLIPFGKDDILLAGDVPLRWVHRHNDEEPADPIANRELREGMRPRMDAVHSHHYSGNFDDSPITTLMRYFSVTKRSGVLVVASGARGDATEPSSSSPQERAMVALLKGTIRHVEMLTDESSDEQRLREPFTCPPAAMPEQAIAPTMTELLAWKHGVFDLNPYDEPPVVEGDVIGVPLDRFLPPL